MLTASGDRRDAPRRVRRHAQPFLGNLLYIVLIVLLVLTAFRTLGVETTSFVAIVGAAGLAVGLALKDSLSNFSSGVMLVFFRPFQVGDQIDAAGVSGVVESIGIFNVVLKTPDNRVINVPNSLVYAGTITNYNAESTRRIDLTIAIGYDADIPQAKSVIAAVVARRSAGREAPGAGGRRAGRADDGRDARRARVGRYRRLRQRPQRSARAHQACARQVRPRDPGRATLRCRRQP